VFEKEVLRILGHNKEKKQGGGENYIMRRFITWVLHLLCLGVWTDETRRRFGKMTNTCTASAGKPQRNNLPGGDVSANWKIKLKQIL
jgi:hypothetical protein